jgi:hypothetical protein
MSHKLIIVDFDGTPDTGIFRVYPANEESEPDADFQHDFIYGASWDGEYDTQAQARAAAHNTAKRLAGSIGGNWATNE